MSDFPRLKTVRSHKHTCANVQPGSTYADKCDCGALDTAGHAIEITTPVAHEAALKLVLEWREKADWCDKGISNNIHQGGDGEGWRRERDHYREIAGRLETALQA